MYVCDWSTLCVYKGVLWGVAGRLRGGSRGAACMHVCFRMCVWVCVCVFAHVQAQGHTHKRFTYPYLVYGLPA
jgi:hypothetical protein